MLSLLTKNWLRKIEPGPKIAGLTRLDRKKRTQKIQLGRSAEQIAANHLQRIGWRLLRQNHRVEIPSSHGLRTKKIEIDLLVQKDQEVLLVEVKFRRRQDMLSANWAVLTKNQLERLRLAKCYAASKNPHLLFRILLLWVDEFQEVHFLDNY